MVKIEHLYKDEAALESIVKMILIIKAIVVIGRFLNKTTFMESQRILLHGDDWGCWREEGGRQGRGDCCCGEGGKGTIGVGESNNLIAAGSTAT